MTYAMRNKALFLLLAIQFGWLSGCALENPPAAPELASHAIPAPDDHRQWFNGAVTGDPAAGWLASFNDAQLNRLVREAMTHNGDLALAAVRVQQAEALVAEQSSGLLPSAGVKGRVGESESQYLSVGVSWELDLWGRIRAQARAARSEHAASEADYVWAQRVVAATTAKAWFALIKCTQFESKLQQIVDAQAQIVKIEDHRVAIGAAPQTELQEARNKLMARQDALIQATLAKNRASQAMELLLGRYPGGEIQAVQDMPALPAAPPAGLPASLIERRPDMVAASQRVAAAFDQRQSAQAARLPDISINAAITGIRSNVLALMDSSSPVKGVSATLLTPIFTGGRLKAQADYYTLAQKAAIVTYGNCALQALSEVEAGLQAETRYAARVTQLQARVDESQTLLGTQEARATIGSIDRRSVLEERQALLLAQKDLVDVRGDQLNQRVDLLLALGGDWQRSGAAGTNAGDFALADAPASDAAH